MKLGILTYALVHVLILCLLRNGNGSASEVKRPAVLIGILVRNKAHTLPYFLTLLERLDYPKQRISLWIKSDDNVDNSIEILKKWLSSVKNKYHNVKVSFEKNGKKSVNQDQKGIGYWTDERFNHIIQLREEILNYGRQIWADYLLMLDADAFLTNPNTLDSLLSKNLPVVAPLLKSDGLYSNFWHGMTEDFYYERTEDYKPVLNRERIGCFDVPMIHSAVLIHLNSLASDHLTYMPEKVENYTGPSDDIITFAISARTHNIPLHVCNDQVYGFIMVPLEADDTLQHDLMQLTNLKLEVLVENDPLPVNLDVFGDFVRLPAKSKLGFDEIYMINLARRTERRERMLHCFDELGLDVQIVDAVDGRNLSEALLESITFLPEYADPYHKRPMTHGEIGCFMSHYIIWQRIVEEGHQIALVLEDDVRFESFFTNKVRQLMDELRTIPDWDLVYFGRKRLQESDEPWVVNAKYLVEVGYSYWTLGYALTARGARKLLAAQPLDKLLPVDEYLPILFDKHPQHAWKIHYPQRDLRALSAAPLLLYPTHYTGEQGYISDTEDSQIIHNDTDNQPNHADEDSLTKETRMEL